MTDTTISQQPAATPSDASQVATGTSSDTTIPVVTAPAPIVPPAPPMVAKSDLDAANARIAELEAKLALAATTEDAAIADQQKTIELLTSKLAELPTEVTCTTCGTRCPVTH